MNITHEQEPIKQEDSILVSVMANYYERNKRGQAKYGTKMVDVENEFDALFNAIIYYKETFKSE